MKRASRFLQEVNRRNVFRAGAAYIVIAWLVAQVADLLFDTFEAPDWAMQLVILALAIGLPVALILSWAYEITTEGIVPTSEVSPDISITKVTGRKIDFVIIGVLTVAVILFTIERLYWRDTDGGNAQELPAIAVLPFRFDSPSADSYFNRIPIEIARLLQRNSQFHVVSQDAISEVGEDSSFAVQSDQLGADYLVIGTIYRSSDGLALKTQLYNRSQDRISLEQVYEHAHLPQIVRLAAKQIAEIAGDQSWELKAAEVSPAAYAMYLEAQHLFEEEQDYDASEKLLVQAMDLSPRFAPLYSTMCTIYLRRFRNQFDPEDFSIAENYCLRSWTLDNQAPEVLASLAELNLASGQSKRATEYAQAALSINPEFVDGQRLLAKSLEGDEPSTAEFVYQSVIARNPGSPQAYSDLARFYFYQGRADEAIDIQRTATQLLPNNPMVLSNLASILLLAGNFSEAADTFENLIANFAPEPVAQSNLATAKFFSGDFVGAAGIYEDLVRQFPTNWQFARNLGDAIWHTEGPESARRIFFKVVELTDSHLKINPESVDALLDQVTALGSLGQTGRFNATKEELLAISHSDPQTFYSIAVGASRLGDFGLAREYAQRARDNGYPKVFLDADPDIAIAEAASK